MRWQFSFRCRLKLKLEKSKGYFYLFLYFYTQSGTSFWALWLYIAPGPLPIKTVQVWFYCRPPWTCGPLESFPTRSLQGENSWNEFSKHKHAALTYTDIYRIVLIEFLFLMQWNVSEVTVCWSLRDDPQQLHVYCSISSTFNSHKQTFLSHDAFNREQLNIEEFHFTFPHIKQ